MVDVQAQARQKRASNHADLLRQLGAEITHLSGVDTIARHVADRLGQALDLRWVAIILETEATSTVHQWGDCPADLAYLNAGAWARERPRDGQADASDARVVPLVASREPIGALAF